MALIFSATHNDVTCYHLSPSNGIKMREYYKNGSLYKQKKQNPETEAAASLSVIWLRSSHAVVRETP